MIQIIDVPVSVSLEFNHKTRQVLPVTVIWDGRQYLIKKLGYHHTYRSGRTLYHVFSVSADNIFFRLILDTDNLFWRLKEVSDGLPG
ncbi:MAG: hypothetical protein ACOX6N_02985 [Patescibacteria group bacterium]|jgi:hypothetical protein